MLFTTATQTFSGERGQSVHLGVQLTDMVEGRYTLQPRGHVMQVSSDPIPLKPRRVGLCAVQDLMPGGYILHPLLHMSGHLADNAVVLVHGIRSAAAQGLWNLLGQLRHLEDGRKALDNRCPGTCKFASKLRQPAPELPAAGALGLLPVHQKLQNRRFHVWFLDVIVDVAQRVVYVA